jgi:hypothetical protein
MSKNFTLKYFIIALISTLLSATSMFAQSATTDCAAGTGTAITIGTAVTVNNQTNLGSPTLSATNCGMTNATSSARRDVWYWFTAIAPSMTVTFTPSNSRDAGLIVYDACTTTVLGCSNSGTGSTVETTTITTVVGNTYGVRLLRIANTNDIQGSLVVRIGNNECAGAILLTASSTNTCTAVTGTSVSATQSQTGCSGTADDDVWYSFVATATSHQVTVTPGTMQNPVFQVFSGTCGSLTSLACTNNSTGNTTAEVSNVTGLTIGTTYYVRVHSNGNASGQGTFTICINNIALANDECSGAISITPSSNTTCNLTNGTTVGASQSQAGCSGNADDDVWYSFVASASSHQIRVERGATGGFNNAVFELFSGTCGSLTQYASGCVNAGGANSDPEQRNFAGLTIGNTYFVRVYSNGGNGNQGTFGICITSIAPANDDCQNAITLTVNTGETCVTSTDGTTVNASQTLAGCVGTADDDVWYKFVATNTAHRVTVTRNTMTDAVFEVFSGSCGSLTSIGCTDGDFGTIEVNNFHDLVVGQTYYVRVYDWYSFLTGTFSICVSVPTDPCLTIGSIASCGETTNATISGGGSWNSYTGVTWAVPGQEMLWTYTPNISGAFVVDVQSLTGGYFVDFYFREATTCGYSGWTYIDDFSATGVSAPFNLVAGTQYYILLDDENYTSSTVSFILRREDNTPCQSLVSMGNTSLSLIETGGSFNIPINVVNPSPTSSINVTLTAVSGNLSRIDGFTSAVLTIPAGASTFNYSINLTDNTSCEDFQTIVFELSNISSVASAALTSPTSLSAIIEDNETEYQTLVSTGFETTDPAYAFDLSSTNPWAASTTNPISGLRSFVSGASGAAGQNYFSTDLNRAYYAGMTSVWRFQINHFGNEPDNTTKWQVILSSDQKDLTSASLNGYAVGVNPLTPIASDLVTLWRISNGAYIPIYTSSMEWESSTTTVGFEITRDENGLWTLKYDSNGGFDALVALGTGTDETYSYASNYGVRYYYASGNGQKLAIDDMSFIQKGCRETIYSVTSGNSSSSVWSNTSNGTAVSKNIGRLTSVIVQTTHNVTMDEPMVTNNLTVSGGGTLTCNSQDVVLHGNLNVIGSMAALSNSIVFKGNAAQTFTYPSNFNVNNITLYNSLPVNTGSALTLGANLNLRGVLSPEFGKINVNNNLTLISNATVTGSIGEIKSTADVIGTITAQRYLPAALQNYVNLGSPITGLTLGDWNDDLVTSGFPGSDYPTYNFNSLYTYNEVLPGDRNTGWVGATSISNPLLTNKGYMVYMTGAANTIDATGAFQKGNVSVPLSLTNTSSAGDGWNLMLNPYPSEVDWNQVVANSNGVTSYYVYDSQTGAYKSYNGATSTGNASRYIPMGQSFFVGATVQGSSLNYTEAMKTATNSMLERSYVRPNGFVFELSRGQFKEELMLLTSPEATADFEDSHDAYRLVGPVAEMHSLYSKSSDSEKLAIDVRQSWGENNIPLYVNAPTKGKYTLTVSALPMSNDITCWIIKDLETGVELPLEVGMKIMASIEANFEGVRWIIEPRSLVSFGSLQADNFTTDNGSIDVVSSNDSWNYTLVNELGTTVSSSASTSSYTGLAAGRYTVAFSSSTGCAAQQVEVVIGSGNLVSAEAIVAAQEAANESASIVTDELNPIQLGTMSGAWMIQWKDNYEGKVKMTVYNGVGQIVMTESLDGSTRTHVIPNGKFSEGAYVIALSQDDKQLFSGSCLVIE